MIARKAHPQYPGDLNRFVFVALWFDRQSGEWRPLRKQGFSNVVDAGRICVLAFQGDWGKLRADTRVLRAHS